MGLPRARGPRRGFEFRDGGGRAVVGDGDEERRRGGDGEGGRWIVVFLRVWDGEGQSGQRAEEEGGTHGSIHDAIRNGLVIAWCRISNSASLAVQESSREVIELMLLNYCLELLRCILFSPPLPCLHLPVSCLLNLPIQIPPRCRRVLPEVLCIGS